MNYIGEREPHYGLRKLSIGVASVLLGISICGVVGHADNEVPVGDSKNNVSVSKNVGDVNNGAKDQVVLQSKTGGDSSSTQNIGRQGIRNQGNVAVNGQQSMRENTLNTSGVQNGNGNRVAVNDSKVQANSDNTAKNVSGDWTWQSSQSPSTTTVVEQTIGGNYKFRMGANFSFDVDGSQLKQGGYIDIAHLSQISNNQGMAAFNNENSKVSVLLDGRKIGNLEVTPEALPGDLGAFSTRFSQLDYRLHITEPNLNYQGIQHISVHAPWLGTFNFYSTWSFRGVKDSLIDFHLYGDGLSKHYKIHYSWPKDIHFKKYQNYQYGIKVAGGSFLSETGGTDPMISVSNPILYNADQSQIDLMNQTAGKQGYFNLSQSIDYGMHIYADKGNSVLLSKLTPNLTMQFNFSLVDTDGSVIFDPNYPSLDSLTLSQLSFLHSMSQKVVAPDMTLSQLKALNMPGNVVSQQSDGSALAYFHLPLEYLKINFNDISDYALHNIIDMSPYLNYKANSFDDAVSLLKGMFNTWTNSVNNSIPSSFSAMMDWIYVSDPSVHPALHVDLLNPDSGAVLQSAADYGNYANSKIKGQSTVKLHIISSTNGTDLATVKSFTDWPNQGKHAQLDIPTIAGYQLSNDPQSVLTKFHLNGKVITANSAVDYPAENTIADYYIVMTPKDENMTVNIVDDDENGKVLDSGTISGKFGDKVVESSDIQGKIKKMLDSGLYTLESDDLDNGLTFKDGSQTATVKLKHKLDSVQRHYRVIEDLPDGTKKVIIDMEATLYKDASVDYYAENGAYLRGDIHQKLLKPDSFRLIVRDGKADLIDNQAVTYIDQVSGYRFSFKDATNKYLDAVMTNSFIEHGVPKVYFDLFNGNPAIKYNDLVNGAAAVLPLSSRDFHIVYTKNQYPVTIAYYDQTGKQVASSTKSYDYLTQLDLSATVPANYVLLSGQPGQLTVGTDINEVDLLVAPKIERSQENKVITRTINLHGGNVKIGPVIQKVVFVREKVSNLATGDTSYGNWQVQGDDQFSMYVPPIIDGYHINKVDAKIVSADDSDSTVDLNYEQNESEQWPMYIDVNGKSCDKLPDGYHVVKGQNSKKGSLLIVKDDAIVVSPKIEYVTRTITVIMPNGRTRTIKQKARKGSKFFAAHLPKLKGYRVEINGNIDGVAANGDMTASVKFVKL